MYIHEFREQHFFARSFVNMAFLSASQVLTILVLLWLLICHNTLSLHHNFTIRPSTGVYESRILSSVHYELLDCISDMFVYEAEQNNFFIPRAYNN